MRTLTAFAAFVALGVSALAAPPVPRPAKELDVAEPSGVHHLLSSYKGKVVVVQFLFTTCPHCQAFSRDILTKLQKDYGPRGFQALGVAFDEADNTKVKNYVTMYNVGFPVGPAARDTVLSFMGFSIMDRLVVPQIAVVDRKGTLVAQTEANPDGPAKLQNEAYLRGLIENLLGGAPATGAAAKSTTPNASSAPKKATDGKKPVSE
jgi:thiol-disulfide isomerase/thioredoxin